MEKLSIQYNQLKREISNNCLVLPKGLWKRCIITQHVPTILELFPQLFQEVPLVWESPQGDVSLPMNDEQFLQEYWQRQTIQTQPIIEEPDELQMVHVKCNKSMIEKLVASKEADVKSDYNGQRKLQQEECLKKSPSNDLCLDDVDPEIKQWALFMSCMFNEKFDNSARYFNTRQQKIIGLHCDYLHNWMCSKMRQQKYGLSPWTTEMMNNPCAHDFDEEYEKTHVYEMINQAQILSSRVSSYCKLNQCELPMILQNCIINEA